MTYIHTPLRYVTQPRHFATPLRHATSPCHFTTPFRHATLLRHATASYNHSLPDCLFRRPPFFNPAFNFAISGKQKTPPRRGAETAAASSSLSSSPSSSSSSATVAVAAPKQSEKADRVSLRPRHRRRHRYSRHTYRFCPVFGMGRLVEGSRVLDI